MVTMGAGRLRTIGSGLTNATARALITAMLNFVGAPDCGIVPSVRPVQPRLSRRRRRFETRKCPVRGRSVRPPMLIHRSSIINAPKANRLYVSKCSLCR